jgi:putative toxin-antitoxin system antitoxin component (TIGR02293 family)
MHATPARAPGSSLGLKNREPRELLQRLQKGLPFAALATFSSRSGLAAERIAALLDLPARTLARRKAASRFSPGESERLLRLSWVFEKAVDLFEGDVSAATLWLTTPKKALGNALPLDYSRTEIGGREVENLISRLEHGVFA